MHFDNPTDKKTDQNELLSKCEEAHKRIESVNSSKEGVGITDVGITDLGIIDHDQAIPRTFFKNERSQKDYSEELRCRILDDFGGLGGVRKIVDRPPALVGSEMTIMTLDAARGDSKGPPVGLGRLQGGCKIQV